MHNQNNNPKIVMQINDTNSNEKVIIVLMMTIVAIMTSTTKLTMIIKMNALIASTHRQEPKSQNEKFHKSTPEIEFNSKGNLFNIITEHTQCNNHLKMDNK